MTSATAGRRRRDAEVEHGAVAVDRAGDHLAGQLVAAPGWARSSSWLGVSAGLAALKLV